MNLGMGYTCYPNYVPSAMDEFERNLYLFYWNGLNPSPRIEIKHNPRIDDYVQGNDLLHNDFERNAASQQKELEGCFMY